jgi:hypothetical protein
MRLATAWGCALLLVSVPVGAQPSPSGRAVARDEGYSGVAHFNAGDYQTAYRELDHAYSVLQAPSLGLWSARCLVKLNRWVEASERFRVVLRSDPKLGDTTVQQQALTDATTELHELEARLPALRIEVSGAPTAEVSISLDGSTFLGQLVGERVPVNPGPHSLEAHWKDQRRTQSVTSVEAQEQKVVLKFVPVAAPASPQGAASSGGPPERASSIHSASGVRRTLGWTLLGGGAAGVVVGLISGGLAMSKKGSLEASPDCRGQQCLPSQQGGVDSYNTLRLVSGIGLIAGAALATTGVVLLVVPQAPPAATASVTPRRVWLGVAPNSVALGGNFQ